MRVFELIGGATAGEVNRSPFPSRNVGYHPVHLLCRPSPMSKLLDRNRWAFGEGNLRNSDVAMAMGRLLKLTRLS
ncbi:hypothetical protein NPIL_332201 [Nephila pilipes]|uniref:Uncharacterized protein n=1 Tax=Nephila pilipes TaxID=299642 RepID=A0A8X6QES7_NEPPI|nr:hypothetical protein NPIL_332201 [Nephila pilipes]